MERKLWIDELTEKELKELNAKPEVIESEIETDEPGMCLGCKEHACVTIFLENGEEVERVSNCCGTGIWEW